MFPIILEQISATLAFASITLVAIISFNRFNMLMTLWNETIDSGKVDTLTSDELMQPWLIRIYQRAYAYLCSGRISVVLAIVIFLQVLTARTDSGSTRDMLRMISVISELVFVVVSFMYVFSSSLGLRKELKELRKRFPDHTITMNQLRQALRDEGQIDIQKAIRGCEFDEDD